MEPWDLRPGQAIIRTVRDEQQTRKQILAAAFTATLVEQVLNKALASGVLFDDPSYSDLEELIRSGTDHVLDEITRRSKDQDSEVDLRPLDNMLLIRSKFQQTSHNLHKLTTELVTEAKADDERELNSLETLRLILKTEARKINLSQAVPLQLKPVLSDYRPENFGYRPDNSGKYKSGPSSADLARHELVRPRKPYFRHLLSLEDQTYLLHLLRQCGVPFTDLQEEIAKLFLRAKASLAGRHDLDVEDISVKAFAQAIVTDASLQVFVVRRDIRSLLENDPRLGEEIYSLILRVRGTVSGVPDRQHRSLTRRIFQKVKQRVCPLYPFCGPPVYKQPRPKSRRPIS